MPKVYAEIYAEKKKEIDRVHAPIPFFLNSIAGRILQGFRIFDALHNAYHMSLQYDGAEMLIDPFPRNFRPNAQLEIQRYYGFRVNLVGKRLFRELAESSGATK